MAREDLISDDTFDKLLEKDAVMKLKNVIDILKNEYSLKIGRGLFKVLPIGPPFLGTATPTF